MEKGGIVSYVWMNEVFSITSFCSAPSEIVQVVIAVVDLLGVPWSHVADEIRVGIILSCGQPISFLIPSYVLSPVCSFIPMLPPCLFYLLWGWGKRSTAALSFEEKEGHSDNEGDHLGHSLWWWLWLEEFIEIIGVYSRI